MERRGISVVPTAVLVPEAACSCGWSSITPSINAAIELVLTVRLDVLELFLDMICRGKVGFCNDGTVLALA